MAGQLAILNPWPKKLKGPSLLHNMVARLDDSDSVAIEYFSAQNGVESVSYQQLQHRANALATTLRSIRKKTAYPDHARFLIPIYIAQGPDLYVSQLAVLKAGGAFCPISLDVPEERLRFILQDLDARVLLTTSDMKDTLPSFDGVSIVLTNGSSHDTSAREPAVDIDPSHPAYIMYTSGSTGQPKGVIISHSAATQALLAHERHIPNFSRFLQFASPTFDVSVFEVFFPFFRGSTLVCCDRRRLLNDLPGMIDKMNIDAAELTPSVASSLLSGRASVPSLKLLLTIGELLKRDVVNEFGGPSGQESILYGMYGPTEATIHCTLQPRFSDEMRVENIGEPLETVSAFVIKPQPQDNISDDEGITILPLEEEGELAIGGHQLADGYLNRKEQTTAAFVHHPRYGRIYRTGDRARLRSNGMLECLGRVSNGQIKLRGQRIELGEIEHAASKTPGCRSVIAEVINGILVAFCILNDTALVEADIRDTCRRWLPSFMVPGDIVFLDALPYLASGKADRKALRSLYEERQNQSMHSSGEITNRCQILVDIIGDVLRCNMGVDTALSGAGMDSLSSIRIASQLHKAGLPQVDATQLLETQTIRHIDDYLQTLGESPVDQAPTAANLRETIMGSSLIAESSNNIDDVFVATAMQSAMLSETLQNSQAYCNWVEFEIYGQQREDRVENILHELAHTHPLLRSGFLSVKEIESSYAVVTWKRLLPTQIRRTSQFDYIYQITTEADLLRPCFFQILPSNGGFRVLLQLHHSLYDQWSIDVLRDDFATLIQGRSLNQPPPFRTISALQSAQVEDAQSNASSDFWQDHLRDFSPSILSPMISKRASHELRRTQWIELPLNLPIIRRQSRNLGCTMPSIFQAAMVWILGCYVGTHDVTYGTVFSGRHLPVPGIDRVFGPCLATLPLRVDFSATRTCADLVRLVHDRNREMQRHAQVSLTDIKAAGRCPPGSKLFDTLLIWQETILDDRGSDKIVQEVDSADHHEFSLVLELEPAGEGIKVRATYLQSLISSEQIQLLFQQLQALVQHMVSKPDYAIADLSHCLPEHMLSISNPTPTRCSIGRSITATIEGHASRSPTSPALVFARSLHGQNVSCQTLTYDDLNKQANRLARFLQSRGVLPDDLVCICMDKDANLYVAILATLKAGAGYLPLLPETPAPRIESILKQAKPKLCLCNNFVPQGFHNSDKSEIIELHDLELSSFNSDDLKLSHIGSHIAYTVFTSGSTGEPKGVAVTMDNLLGNLQALSELYNVDRKDRMLQACSQAFDVSVFEIFFSFYSGMCLCSATKDILFQDLEASISALNVTLLSLTPTVVSLVDPKNVPSVRFLVTAGEGVTDLVQRKWANNGLHQGYGPSETTNICTINMDMSKDDCLGNIGKPFPNTSGFVLSHDVDFQILPIGAIGEFAFGGEQVFRGYIDREQLNAEKIIEHPKFGRLYRSGDMGRILPDGSLLISGRIDDQVKLRGNRIELGEINAVALQIPEVHDCTTFVVGDEVSQQSLVVFIVPAQWRTDRIEETQLEVKSFKLIRDLFVRLEAYLPQYMMPSTILPVTNLPLTTQGKLDKGKLQQLLTSLDNETKTKLSYNSEELQNTQQWSAEEQQLAVALAETLHVPESTIKQTSSFFALGLNSLNSVAFSKHVASRLRTFVSVGQILSNPSIARLARTLSTTPVDNPSSTSSFAQDVFPATVVEEIRRTCEYSDTQIECILPCTPLQDAMLSASTSTNGSTYRNSTTMRIVGDLTRLQDCIKEMVKRHGILRTRFVETSSPTHPYAQVILRCTKLPWTEYTSSSQGDSTSANSILDFGGQHSANNITPFRIEVNKSDRQVELVFYLHHAIYDGISLSRLMEEIEELYNEKELLPPTPFEPFLKQVETQQGTTAMAFWKSQLNGFEPKLFPRAHSTEISQEGLIDGTLQISSSDIDAFCRRHSISHLATFQAAFAKTLVCCQKEDDICFGNIVSGRTVAVAAIDRLVAPCFNTIPVRAKVAGIRNNLDLARHIHKINLASINHQLTALRRVQTLSVSPMAHLFDSMLLLQPSQRSIDHSIWHFKEESGVMGLPLVLEICPQDDNFRMLLHYLQPIISRSLAEDIATAFNSALSSLLKFPLSNTTHFIDFDSEKISGFLRSQPVVGQNASTSIVHTQEQWEDDEVAVRQVLSQLAGVNLEHIQRNTSMYQIGLDSLNAAQVASQLRSQGFQVDAADIIESLTPAGIAAATRQKASSSHQKATPIDFQRFSAQHCESIVQSLHLPVKAVEALRPCTSIQSGMLVQSLQSEDNLYINHVAYRIPPSISTLHLQQAWKAVQERHQILRMGFHRLDEPQTPFAMVIFNPEFSDLPFSIADNAVGLSTVEMEARDVIIKSLHSKPWQIRIQESEQSNIMLLSLHHALYDADSLRLILSDVARSLAGNKIGPKSDIDPVLSFTLENSIDYDGSSASFWSETLQQVSFSKFPDLAPRKVLQKSLDSESITSSISLSRVEKFCQDQGATLQGLGQTIWAMLLAAYVGEPKVTFGTILSGKSTSDDWNVAFPNITTIPVCCDTDKPALAILKDMVRYNASTQRHRFAPLADIQRFAKMPGQSMFDTVFVYQKAHNFNNAPPNWTIIKETAAVDYTASLELEITSSREVVFRLTFNTSYIPRQHARLIVRQYDHLFDRVISGSHQGQTVCKDIYSICPAKELRLPTAARFLHSFVEQGASRNPEQIALEFVYELKNGEPLCRAWTYAELNDRGNQVAHLIRQSKVPVGSIIAVSMEKCPEASFAFVGILKAGCAFLAMDPNLPESRVKFILEDSGAKLLLCHKTTAPSAIEEILCILDIQEKTLVGLPKLPLTSVDLSPDATCYCLYTSGTTGTPKGCEITHENSVQAMLSFQRLFAGRWDHNSKWLQFASYWFDVSILEQFWSWSVGITVVGASRDTLLEDLSTFIQQLRITHIDLTPSLARLLQPDDVKTLWDGVFITGGEALKQEIIDSWGSKRVICNGYGPTEATIGVTMNTFLDSDAKPSNIGRQFDNVGTFVLRPGSDEPVLRGALGELCVSGKLVGKGYLNRPDLTKKSFPFLDRLGKKVYRTGDLVRLLADDSFAFVGRQDSQTKLRGQRLEIGEIDSIIQQCANDVVDVVSLVLQTNDGHKETLVSFFTSTSGVKSQQLKVDSSAQMRHLTQNAKEACMRRLPGYMVPTHVLPVNFVPLTVNNKVDTKLLAALFYSLSSKHLQALGVNDPQAQSLNSQERRIVSALSTIFPIDSDQVAKGSNLFSLGLSSISAISFSNVLRKSGFEASSVSAIMKNPTLGQLASALKDSESPSRGENQSLRQTKLWMAAYAQRYRNVAQQRLSTTAETIETIAPCTPLQQGLLLDSIRDAKRPYFNHFLYTLGDVDIKRLKKAFDTLVRGAQVLRTRFLNTDEGFAQVVLRDVELPLSEISMNSKDIPDFMNKTKKRWLEQNNQEIERPFELHVIHSSTSNFMLIHVHHALYDGISFELMLSRLEAMYKSNSSVDCGPAFISALPYGPILQNNDAKAFWTNRIGDFRQRPLPMADVMGADEDVVAAIEINRVEDLEQARKKLGVSHQALLQACFEIALRNWTSATQLYGLVVSGRSIEFEGADRILGPMFNTLPQPLSVNSKATWSEHVHHCHELNIQALPYQHTSLRDIRKWCKREPSDPMFDVIFVFQAPHVSEETKGEELWKPVDQILHADYALACETELQGDGRITVSFIAQRKNFDQERLQTLLENFNEAIERTICGSEELICQKFTKFADSNGEDFESSQTPESFANGTHHFEWTHEASIFRETIANLAGLNIEDVDEQSTLFTLGLDSIDAVKLTSRLRNAGISIPVSKLLQAQTIPRMLQVEQSSDTSPQPHSQKSKLKEMEYQLNQANCVSLVMDPKDIETILPATPNQEALLADMFRSEFRHYFNHDVVRLPSKLDLNQFKHAWQVVFDANPILRTSFHEVTDPNCNAAYAQVVHRPFALRFAETTITGYQDLDKLLDTIRQDAVATADKCPLCLLTFAMIESQRHLLISLSHAQYDGHSLALLHEDVSRAYNNSFTTRPSYSGVIERSLTANSEDARNFWKNLLSDAPNNSFPRERPDEDVSVTHRNERLTSVSVDTARSACQKLGVSMQALAQTCWALVLAAYTQSLEVLFGVVLACRDSEETERIMFPTMNTVVLRASLHGSRAQMLQYMQSNISSILPFQWTPLRMIQSSRSNVLRNSETEQRYGLFDTLFIYQQRPRALENKSEPLYESIGGDSSVEYPVAAEMEAIGDEIYVRAACKANVLDERGIADLLDKMNHVLQSIIDSPNENTVEFGGKNISICGLESFRLQDSLLDNQPVNNDKNQEKDHMGNETSTLMPGIMQALAEVSKTSMDDLLPTSSIESIGIDSISAIKVAALLRKRSIQLSVSNIIQSKTPYRMARLAEANPQQPSSDVKSSSVLIAEAMQQFSLQDLSAMNGIDPQNVQKVMPATAGQLYMINMWRKTGGQIFYSTFSYEIDANVGVEQLHQAWSEVVKRHVALRVIFAATEDPRVPLVQIVLNNAPAIFYSERETGDVVQSDQPMVSLRAIRKNRTYLLNLKIHHALYDAISLPLLMQDFQGLLTGSSNVESEVGFEDYIALSITSQALRARKDHWTRYLQDARPMKLAQPLVAGLQKRVEIFRPALFDKSDQLESLARKENISIQAILFAAYAKLYAEFAHHDASATDVVLGIYLSNRSHLAELDSLSAPTVNLVPLLVHSPRQRDVLDIAKRIQPDLQEVGTAENSAAALWEIAEWTGVKVDTFVNFLKLPDQSATFGLAEGIRLQALDDRRLLERSQVIEPVRDGEFAVPQALRDLRKTDAYEHSVDLEMTIADGKLDVGLFCPEAMLSLAGAETAVARLGTLLNELVGTTAA